MAWGQTWRSRPSASPPPSSRRSAWLVPGVIRYNKRYVSGYNEVDYQSYYTKLDLNGMLSDADQVLRAAQADPHVDPRRVFLYGWSEGSTVAAALAATHPEVAGVVFQAPVTQPWRDLFDDQVDRVGAPYLREFDVDGKLEPEELKAAIVGGGGLVATQSIGSRLRRRQPATSRSIPSSMPTTTAGWTSTAA